MYSEHGVKQEKRHTIPSLKDLPLPIPGIYFDRVFLQLMVPTQAKFFTYPTLLVFSTTQEKNLGKKETKYLLQNT
jgi:hypothetical protein